MSRMSMICGRREATINGSTMPPQLWHMPLDRPPKTFTCGWITAPWQRTTVKQTYILMAETGQDLNFPQGTLTIRLVFKRTNLLDGNLHVVLAVPSRATRKKVTIHGY